MTCSVALDYPTEFPFERKEKDSRFKEYSNILRERAVDLILKGCDRFIVSMTEGAEMDFIKTVLRLKEVYTHVSLEVAVPLEDSKYSFGQNCDCRLEICDELFLFCTNPLKKCSMLKRRFMIDNSEYILAFWNGKKSGETWQSIEYACEAGKNVIVERL